MSVEFLGQSNYMRSVEIFSDDVDRSFHGGSQLDGGPFAEGRGSLLGVFNLAIHLLFYNGIIYALQFIINYGFRDKRQQ